jgi:hypothetical protein
MSHKKDAAPQVEFINLMGDAPVVIAAGSFEEVTEAIQEGQAIDRDAPHPYDEGVSSGAYHALGKLSAGLGPEAQASLEDYSTTIQRAKQGQREMLRRLGTE